MVRGARSVSSSLLVLAFEVLEDLQGRFHRAFLGIAHSHQTADGFFDLQLFLQGFLGLGLYVTELFLHFIDSDLSVDLVEGVHDPSEYQVDEEEGAEDHYQQEVDRRPVVTPRILHLLNSLKSRVTLTLYMLKIQPSSVRAWKIVERASTTLLKDHIPYMMTLSW
jgi:hypothetical protein